MFGLPLSRAALRLTLTLCVLGLSACGGGGGGTPSGNSSSTTPGQDGLSAMAALGEKIFHDPSLSLNGNQSCASCHAAERGHAGPLASGMTEPGSDGSSVGTRLSPSIRYLSYNKAFRFEDGTPTGGFFWDGRALTLSEQAKAPFLNPREMANADAAAVAGKLAAASYAAEFKALFGADVFNDPDAAFERAALALQAFEKEEAAFRPFSSKYDAFLRGENGLSASELRGLALFNSGTKGNCAACHPSKLGTDGSFPLFTDFSYDALGVPRNWTLANASGTVGVYDLGLCESAAVSDLSDAERAALCGKFKVPSLRNVGLRKAFFHNGRFTKLTDVVTFYVQRDIHPELFYLDANGAPDVKFNDFPAADHARYSANVNVTEVPYNRHPGDLPALDAGEIADVVAFLCTLTDDWASHTTDCNR